MDLPCDSVRWKSRSASLLLALLVLGSAMAVNAADPEKSHAPGLRGIDWSVFIRY
jgi:hypothetical protein